MDDNAGKQFSSHSTPIVEWLNHVREHLVDDHVTEKCVNNVLKALG